jgi:UDP-N-acetylmuramate: L-alanyl-gamma-D-glutamyl-meso-diaminopimelate ligase
MKQGFQNGVSIEIPLLTPPALIHLMGICGTGMASLAGMFHDKGYLVAGSDQHVYPPMSDLLRHKGIRIFDGYRGENLVPRPDLVIVGNVIRKTNPEAVELERSGVPYTSMPAALSRYFAADKKRVVVAGTHGKTTLTAMIAWILYSEGLDPSYMIGGVPINFGANGRLGKGPHFVIEGDEYDTAYFDKTPKFLHYEPDLAVVTSCEFDHADIYESLSQIMGQFRLFVEQVPSSGCISANMSDARVREIVQAAQAPIDWYGCDNGHGWALTDVTDTAAGMEARIVGLGGRAAYGTLPVIGAHNLMNALGAVAAVERLGVAPDRAMAALGSFRGVKRRQEIVGEISAVTVIDDFAHHPTAVSATCAGVRSRYPARRLIAVFEPATNTSRRAVFQDDYARAFDHADLVLVREPRRKDGLREGDRFSSEKLAGDLRSLGKPAWAFAETEGIIGFLAREMRRNDIVLIMSNGSFDHIASSVLSILREGLQ